MTVWALRWFLLPRHERLLSAGHRTLHFGNPAGERCASRHTAGVGQRQRRSLSSGDLPVRSWRRSGSSMREHHHSGCRSSTGPVRRSPCTDGRHSTIDSWPCSPASERERITSESPELAITARALKSRGLITMPKRGGKWQAAITDDGGFYLEHGHHPDRPEPAPRKQRPVAAGLKPEVAAPARRRAAPPPEPKPAPTRTATSSQRATRELGLTPPCSPASSPSRNRTWSHPDLPLPPTRTISTRRTAAPSSFGLAR